MKAAGDIGAIAVAAGVRAGGERDRARVADLGGETGIGDQRRRVGDLAGALPAERLGEALQGAAGDDVAGADPARAAGGW